MARARVDEFTIDTAGLKALSADLRRVSKDDARALGRRLKNASGIVAAEARNRTTSRIAGSIRASSSASGASVTAGGPKAPHAAALENRGKPGTFRHPVFGRDVWVTQPARPFLGPALETKSDAVVDEVAEVIMDLLGQAGFK